MTIFDLILMLLVFAFGICTVILWSRPYVQNQAMWTLIDQLRRVSEVVERHVIRISFLEDKCVETDEVLADFDRTFESIETWLRDLEKGESTDRPKIWPIQAAEKKEEKR